MADRNQKWKDLFGEEYGYFQQLYSAIVEPKDKEEFRENMKNLKMQNPKWSIYELFPNNETAVTRAMNRCLRELQPIWDRMPKASGGKVVRSKLEIYLGELVELGAHQNGYGVCPWKPKGTA